MFRDFFKKIGLKKKDSKVRILVNFCHIFQGDGGKKKKVVEYTTLQGGVKVPCSPKIFSIEFSSLARLFRVKVYTPGIVKAKAMLDDKVVSCKIFNYSYVDDIEEFFTQLNDEVNRWKALRHDNLVVFHGVYMDCPRFGIVTQYNLRNVKDLIENSGNTNGAKTGCSIKWGKKVKILLDVATGMEFLHKNNVIHRSLCCENIYITRENKCVIDGHIMSHYEDRQEEERRAKKFGPYYQSPESTNNGLSGETPTLQADVFSFSMVMFELLTEKIDPFSVDNGGTDHDIAMKMKNDPTLRPVIPNDFAVNKRNVWWIDMMKSCWEYLPYRRLHFDDIRMKLEEQHKKLTEGK